MLDLANIQGHILPGFGTKFQVLLFLRIGNDHRLFKLWLRAMVPRITTALEVWPFRRFFREIRKGPAQLQVLHKTWISVAFSHRGLGKLASDIDSFKDDEAFRQGMALRSEDLGDPSDPSKEGHQSNWKVGGKNNPADLVLILASDDGRALRFEVDQIVESLRGIAQVVYLQAGSKLDDSREHFGFRDAISQPGLKGLPGEPYQYPVSPGEFVF